MCKNRKQIIYLQLPVLLSALQSCTKRAARECGSQLHRNAIPMVICCSSMPGKLCLKCKSETFHDPGSHSAMQYSDRLLYKQVK